METIARENAKCTQTTQARRLEISGIVQGMGFRPYVFRLARQLDLKGWVRNTRRGVEIVIEGRQESLSRFLCEVVSPPGSLARIQKERLEEIPIAGLGDFQIRESREDGSFRTALLPDIATCAECLKEIHDPVQRRFRYPFTNCTCCGPRFTITQSLPYDRARTSMRGYSMCSACRKEYEDPEDRRFHAQPIACPECGPQLSLWNAEGKTLARRDDALLKTVELLQAGCIVAVKGVGGFHLMVDAANEQAVQMLRRRKHRQAKPFALIFPSLSEAKEAVDVNAEEERLLTSAAGPIVLLDKKNPQSARIKLADSIALRNPMLGVMLPSNPLHHLLLEAMGRSLVATSGNLSEEPLCHEENEAVRRLQGIVDFFLVHDRPIIHPADDSIVRVVCGRGQVLRRARGYTPLPIPMECGESPVLGLGGQLKSTLALSGENGIRISQHLGDIQTAAAHDLYQKTLNSFQGYPEKKLACVAHDFHPDYESTQFAETIEGRLLPIQHHVAHVFSCVADHQLEFPVLGVAWDGAGYGVDGTLWGGEIFAVTQNSIQRFATFKSFPLAGGSRAIRQPERTAIGLMYALHGDACFKFPEVMRMFPDSEMKTINKMLKTNTNCPLTSSCGRLFDAVSALAGFRGPLEFEGQAAMDLEFSALEDSSVSAYSWKIEEANDSLEINGKFQWSPRVIIDWAPMLVGVLEDVRSGAPRSLIAKKFHNALAQLITEIAGRAGIEQVALSGGCFQNRLLTENTVERLRRSGFRSFWHRQVPPNDGGLSVGQVAAALWQLQGETG